MKRTSTITARSFSLSADPCSSSQDTSRAFWTVPNIITLTRISASPLLVYAIANDMKTLAMVGCVAGGASDWLDGYIARNYNQKVVSLLVLSVHFYSFMLFFNYQSVWGGILDPLADKIFIGCLATGLTFHSPPLIPPLLLALILGRDLCLVLGGVILRAVERPPGAPFFDSSTATFQIVPTRLSKVM